MTRDNQSRPDTPPELERTDDLLAEMARLDRRAAPVGLTARLAGAGVAASRPSVLARIAPALTGWRLAAGLGLAVAATLGAVLLVGQGPGATPARDLDDVVDGARAALAMAATAQPATSDPFWSIGVASSTEGASGDASLWDLGSETELDWAALDNEEVL